MLKRYWYIACPSRDLGRRPLGTTLLGQPIVLFRRAGGAPAALEDRCAHRNAPLSRGKMVNGTLECPYHGWRYAQDGTVAEVPALPAGSGEADAVQIASFGCVEQDGYVWVCLSDAPAAERPPLFPHLREPGWTSFRMKTRFDAPVNGCLENFLDCPHATFVHRHWFRAPTGKPVGTKITTLVDGAQAEYFAEPRERSVVWSLLSPRDAAMRHTDRFIAPATTRVDYIFSNGSHYIITSSCTPVDAHSTLVHTVISFKFGRMGALVRLFFEPLARLIIRQDVKMLEQQYANIRRFGGPRFSFTRADLLAPHIARWRKAIESGSPPPTAGEEHHVEIRL